MAFRNLVAATPGATTIISTAVAATLRSLVHPEGATLQVLPVELLDCLLGFGARAHLHEAEPSGLSGSSIHDHGYGFTGSGLSEESFQILLRHLVTQIPDVELVSQSTPSRPPKRRALRLAPSDNDTCYRCRELPESEVREIARTWMRVFSRRTIRTS